MRGVTIHSSTKTNQLQLNIPDELKGIDLQIIILPANKEDAEIEFFSEEELGKISPVQPETFLEDNEDYSEW